METYREKLKIGNRISALCILVLVLFSALSLLGEAGILPFFSPVAGDSHWQSMWRGFCLGASFGLLAMMVFFLVRNLRALKDEKKLKKLYIKEHDERSIQIWTSARAAAMQTFLLAGIVAVVAAGFFSVTVSLTLLACVFSASLICMGFKVYYSKKF